jgi:hypothetical protein
MLRRNGTSPDHHDQDQTRWPWSPFSTCVTVSTSRWRPSGRGALGLIVITRPGGEPGGAQRGEQGVLHLIGSAQSVNAGVLG